MDRRMDSRLTEWEVPRDNGLATSVGHVVVYQHYQVATRHQTPENAPLLRTQEFYRRLRSQIIGLASNRLS